MLIFISSIIISVLNNNNRYFSIKRPDFDRIAVVGTSCSGKTTFAGQLSKILRIHHFELDALHWLPDWEERPPGEFRALVKKVTSRDKWISDGNYSKVQDIIMQQATDVIWLNYSFPLVIWRGLKRTINRAITREELFSGNRESIGMSFFSRDSLLLWIIKSYKRNHIKYTEMKRYPERKDLRFWEFHKPKEASDFLDELSL